MRERVRGRASRGKTTVLARKRERERQGGRTHTHVLVRCPPGAPFSPSVTLFSPVVCLSPPPSIRSPRRLAAPVPASCRRPLPSVVAPKLLSWQQPKKKPPVPRLLPIDSGAVRGREWGARRICGGRALRMRAHGMTYLSCLSFQQSDPLSTTSPSSPSSTLSSQRRRPNASNGTAHVALSINTPWINRWSCGSRTEARAAFPFSFPV